MVFEREATSSAQNAEVARAWKSRMPIGRSVRPARARRQLLAGAASGVLESVCPPPMPAPAPHDSILVTSLGAYEDSGVGTGGFVSLRAGKSTVIDRLDSTGLCEVDGVVYRFIRGLHSIAGYTEAGVRYLLSVPEVRDAHDLLLRDGQFICVATGNNEVLWIDPLGRIVRRWQAPGERDAWHLNCLTEKEGRLYFSAFGRFAEHRGWVGQCKGKGIIFDLESGAEEVSGLNGPHNPRWIDDQWVVCDSHASGVVLQRPGEAPQRIQLAGFTRGLAWDAHYFYVGESADRKAKVPVLESTVAVISRQTLEVVERYEVPFPEIYELILVQPALAAVMAEDPPRFALDRASAQLRQAQHQVELGTRTVVELNRRLEEVRVYEALRGRLVRWKRRLFG
jgi:hypothetical protein